MESLSYGFEGRRLLFSDNMDSHVAEVRKPLHGEQICCPIKDSIENIGFTGHDLPDFRRNSVLSDETNNHFGNSVLCNSTITLNSLVEPSPRFSSSLASGKRCTLDNSVLTSPEPSVSAKRARASNLQSQNPCCQVYGCGKDLSSSKDYHKRHKVCDAHSKASLVIVNGIQQRFCQQCSRFHLLSEFDEGKRSCRKRLAGHNERRRKPQFDAHLGSTFFRADFPSKTSFFLSKFLPGGLFNPEGNEPTNRIKFEEEPSQVSQLASKFGQSLPKSLLHLHGIGKKYPSKNCLNAPLPSVQDLPVSPSSSFALSLLSAQSHNLLSNSAGMSMAPSLISKQNYHSNLFTDQNSSKSFVSNIFDSSDGVEQQGIPLILDDCASVGLEIPGDGLSRESNSLNLKTYVSPESTNTVNLMELSLHLQRVEQQKHYAHVKLENGEVYPPTSTS